MKRRERSEAGRSRVLTLGTLVFATASMSGCGGGGRSGGEFSSSLNGDQTLGSLSDDERARLCHSQMDYLYSLFDDINYCYYEAKNRAYDSASTSVDDATFRASCSEKYDECVQAPTSRLEEARDLAHNNCDKAFIRKSGCEVTVATFDECVNESGHRVARIIDSSCESISLESFRQSLALESSAKKCSGLSEPCPSDP